MKISNFDDIAYSNVTNYNDYCYFVIIQKILIRAKRMCCLHLTNEQYSEKLFCE